jgi:hypothetical protein
MATGLPYLPSNLYSGGAVLLDSRPFMQYQNQMAARKQAKDEALDQYYQNSFKQVNPAGARTQDIPHFTEKVNEWQRFYQQNRDKIKNPRLDGGRAQSEFQSRLMDAQNYIQQSKNEAKVYEGLVPILRDPDKRSRIPEGVINELAQHDLPLNDPNRKSFNPSSLVFDPKPFDVNMQKNYLQGVQQGLKMDDEITGIKTDPKTFMQTITTTSRLGDEAKGAIRNRASGAYGSDPSFKHFVDNELSQPQNYQRYNDIFKKTYGTDIQEPEDLATAYTLGSIQDEQVKQKSQEDWKARQDYLQGQRINLLNRRLAAQKDGEKDESGWVNPYVDVLKEMGGMNPPVEYKYKNGASALEYDIPLDATLAKALQRGSGQNIREPEYLRYNPKTGKFRPIFILYDEKGNALGKDGRYAVDDQLSQPISEVQLKLGLGKNVTPTQRTVEMKEAIRQQGKASQYKVNGKTYSKQELNDQGYDDDEIAEFIKAGIITQ